MNEKKFALGIGLAGIIFIALLVYLTAPDMLPRSAIVLLPAGGAAAITPGHAMPIQPVAAGSVATECSAERLNSWRLISLGAGGYRQAGFAVLNNETRGSLIVAEAQMFDGNLLLETIAGNADVLRCGQIAQTRVLTDSHGASDGATAPEMRTALPDPSSNTN
jgi:hypothetical protein